MGNTLSDLNIRISRMNLDKSEGYISIVFYSMKESNSLGSIPQILRKASTLETSAQLIELFNKNHILNFINIDDSDIDGKDIDSIKSTLPIYYYYLTNHSYNTMKKDLYIVNPSGTFLLINSSMLVILKKKIVKLYHTDQQKEYDKIVYKKWEYDDLQEFIDFFLTNGKITFLSTKEDYSKKDTIYDNLTDMKKIDVFEDINAIIRYSESAKNLNLYKNESVWAEHLLNSESYGLSVIDNNYNIIYANARRRERHKNNILGKKCYDIFPESTNIEHKPCRQCPFRRLFNAKVLDENPVRLVHKISDKAGNTYWLSENNCVKTVNCGETRIGISVCRDVNFQEEVNILSKKIQSCIQVNEIFKDIIDAFSGKLGFKRVRIYRNFAIEKDRYKLVLVDFSDGQKLNVGHIIDEDLLIHSKVEYQNDCTDSIIHLFKKVNSDQYLHIFHREQFRQFNPKSFKDKIFKEFRELQLGKQWLDLPLWSGDDLIGLISIDLNDDDKWKMISADSRIQLIRGCHFLAGAIQNTITTTLNSTFNSIANKLINISSSFELESTLCKNLYEQADQKIMPFIFWGNNNHYILKGYYEGAYKNWRDIEIDSSNPYFNEVKPVMFNDVRHFNILDFPTNISYHQELVNSFCNIPLRSRKGTFGFLSLLRFGENEIPISPEEFRLYERIADLISERIYSNYSREKNLEIVNSSLSGLYNYGDLKSFSKDLFLQIKKQYPDIGIYLLAVEDNKLKSVSEAGVTGAIDSISEYIIPPASIVDIDDKLVWLKENKCGFTPTILYRYLEDNILYCETKGKLDAIIKDEGIYSDEQINKPKHVAARKGAERTESDIFSRIMFKNKPIGILKIDSYEPCAFDDEFISLVKLLSLILGHIVGLFNEIRRKVDYESSLLHELRTPLQSAYTIMRYNLFQLIGIRVEDYYEMQYNACHEAYTKPLDRLMLYKYLLNLYNNVITAFHFAQNPILDYEKIQIDTYALSLKSVINSIMYIMKSSLKNKPGLDFDFRMDDFVYINCNRSGIESVLYNILSNSVKYSFKVSGSYKKIIIDGEWENDNYLLTITNHGQPVKDDELLLVFEKKYRGSNSHDNSIDGLGLGLYQCKKILEKHNASLEMQTDSRSETKLCILFRDVIKNARRNDDDSLY